MEEARDDAAMNDHAIRFTLEGKVATITLDRPDRLNALSFAAFGEINTALDEAEAGGARVVLLTGEGRAFCSGADLAGEGLPADLGEPIDRYYNPLTRRLAAMDMVFLTAINGPAVGAGAGFALLGDMVLMARSAYLQLAFVNIGLVPDAGTSWLVARAVGRARAMELALLGERIEAEQALDWGLVNRVVEDALLREEAMKLAHRLAAAPLAASLIRRQMRAAFESTLDETLDTERANQRLAGRSADFAEGVSAFLEKRLPRFEGK